ncbi:site-specific DNA-methyltransferase, partial [Candidatus Poribacteria bacterium]|nr:site-specific DNA-methyltransferase [Candidatus Poribacteria bacterium]
MARNTDKEVKDYRHDSSKRKNNPPAGIAGQGRTPDTPKQEYAYNPHLTPTLRSDPSGDVDKIHELLDKAQHETLTPEEAQKIRDALKHHEPWLEWTGKQEAKSFTVDPVALHVHEHVSAKAILKVAARENVQRQLFGDPQQEYNEAVKFYKFDVNWRNRLILGDSLMVMSSLAKREDLAGKVQMIYIDPPYGIKFSSNFQPTVFQRDVKDRDQDLTREPEQIKAYRDTWTLGIHSYLAYLRDRLIVAKDLLTDSGSVFVQISEENIHRIRSIMDEVFGSGNFRSVIAFKTTSAQTTEDISNVCDYIVWYFKDAIKAKKRKILIERDDALLDRQFDYVEGQEGYLQKATQLKNTDSKSSRRVKLDSLTSQHESKTRSGPYKFRDVTHYPHKGRQWATSEEGMDRLVKIDRIHPKGDNIFWIRYADEFGYVPMDNMWLDTTATGTRKSAGDTKIFIVQTMSKVIARCLLMTTDPGDLVLDPTCGSGTAAYVAEKWGRRWITIDTSRVSIALARQRLLTASYDYYKLKLEADGVEGGFVNKRVPHITLGSIANNTALDPIFDNHEPILTEKLDILNNALADITPEIRTTLQAKLVEKEKREGKRSITDADRRRWLLPDTEWQEWEVPFDTDPDWPEPLQDALTDYRKAWRAKMDEVNACIAASSEGEELVDQPEKDSKKVRVSGPFTVEAVQPPEESLNTETPIAGEPDDMDETFDTDSEEHESVNAEAYLDKMVRLLREDGVKFAEDQKQKFATLDTLEGDVLHAEGSWENGDSDRQVAVVFGPQHGPVTVKQVEECLPIASRRGYDELIFAGFTFDGAAQATIQDDPNPRVRIHMAHITPDVEMDDLLKKTSTSQLFTVFGLPRTVLSENDDGEYVIMMEGVDIYNPVDNTVSSAGADKVA